VQEAAERAGLDLRDWQAMTAFTDAYPQPAPRATLVDVVAHVEHVREVAGVDHVGIGGDFDGVSTLPDGLPDVAAYPALLDALRQRGWSADDLTKLASANISRTLRAAEQISVALRDQRPHSLARLEQLDGGEEATGS
jgi:membrane dipeptidase